jgi:hypothetical protein
MWTEFGRKRLLGLEDWEGKEALLVTRAADTRGILF